MQKVYTKIESIVGNVVTVRAKDVRLGDLALVGDSYATVIKLIKTWYPFRYLQVHKVSEPVIRSASLADL